MPSDCSCWLTSDFCWIARSWCCVAGVVAVGSDGGGAESRLMDTTTIISGALEDWGSSILCLRYDLSVAIMTPLVSVARSSMAAS